MVHVKGDSRSVCEFNVVYFFRSVSVLKRKCEASKLTISVVNWLKNLTLLNVRGSCVNQSKTSAFFYRPKFQIFYTYGIVPL